MVSFGDTKVLCNASIEERIPSFLRNQKNKKGWVTAEYGMLPRSTHIRCGREAVTGKQSGRTQEIQRLIGRALRASMDTALLGERTITMDCDVIQADGGTRTAAITGSWVAMMDAVNWLLQHGIIKQNPVQRSICAVSVGVYKGKVITDLDYREDSAAATDMNVVMDDNGDLIEVQGTAEGAPFSQAIMHTMLEHAVAASKQLFAIQQQALAAGGSA